MPPTRIQLNSVWYQVARQELLPAGARQWSWSKRPSKPTDPGPIRTYSWKLSGPMGASAQGDNGYLGVDYTSNIDHRYVDMACLGPAVGSLTLTTNPTGTVANMNGSASILGPSSVRFLYLIRGTKASKVRVLTASLTVDSSESSSALAERITSIVQTRTSAGTEEISLGMAGTAYRVINPVATYGAGADTYSANDEALVFRILVKAPDRTVGMQGQVIQGNVLTGSVTMDASNYFEIATIAGETITPTGFATDGNLWIIGTSNGPYVLDAERGEFFPISPGIDQHSDNCKQMATWEGRGVLIPLQTGLMHFQGGSVEYVGIERYRENTSVVQGIVTALAPTHGEAFYAVIHNPITGTRWLVEGRAREAGDWHPYPYSYYVIAELGSSACEHAWFYGTFDGVRTLPMLIYGVAENMGYIQFGRTSRWPDDSSYTYATSGTWYGTQCRAEPGLLKDVVAAEFFIDNNTFSGNVTASYSPDGGSYVTIGAAQTTSGHKRVLNVSGSAPVAGGSNSGYFIKPRLAWASGAGTTSLRVIGNLRLDCKLRSPMVTEYSFTLQLDSKSDQMRDAETQMDALLALVGTGPYLVTTDTDNDSYYVSIESVRAVEVKETGGPKDRPAAGIRLAQVTAVTWPTVAGE